MPLHTYTQYALAHCPYRNAFKHLGIIGFCSYDFRTTFATQPSINSLATVSLITFLLTLNNQINQPLIFGNLVLARSPCIISAAGYLKYSAHFFYRIRSSKTLNDTTLQSHLLLASDRKFCSSSTVIRS